MKPYRKHNPRNASQPDGAKVPKSKRPKAPKKTVRQQAKGECYRACLHPNRKDVGECYEGCCDRWECLDFLTECGD